MAEKAETIQAECTPENNFSHIPEAEKQINATKIIVTKGKISENLKKDLKRYDLWWNDNNQESPFHSFPIDKKLIVESLLTKSKKKEKGKFDFALEDIHDPFYALSKNEQK